MGFRGRVRTHKLAFSREFFATPHKNEIAVIAANPSGFAVLPRRPFLFFYRTAPRTSISKMKKTCEKRPFPVRKDLSNRHFQKEYMKCAHCMTSAKAAAQNISCTVHSEPHSAESLVEF